MINIGEYHRSNQCLSYKEQKERGTKMVTRTNSRVDLAELNGCKNWVFK